MAAFTASMHAGQGCAITTRLVVPRARYDEAVEAAAATMAGLDAGDPTDPGTICGPVISARQRDRVAGLPRLGDRRGRPIRLRRWDVPPTATRASSSSRPSSPAWTTTPRSPARRSSARCSSVIAHDGDDDAVRIANDSPYGLSGTVFGADRGAGRRRRRAACAPAPSASTAASGTRADVPFGGYKQSGIGREMGVAGFEEYLETKAIATLAAETSRHECRSGTIAWSKHVMEISSRTRWPSSPAPAAASARRTPRRSPREGAAVVVADINVEGAQKVADGIKGEGGNALAVRVDVVDPDSAKEMAAQTLAEFGGIDYLVNNAAIFGGMKLDFLITVDWDYYKKFMSVNMDGALVCTRAVYRKMAKRGGGAIVNQSSTAAWLYSNFYGLAKVGINGLTQQLATELGGQNIRINAIAPGPIDTEANRTTTPQEMVADIVKGIPLSRMGTPEDLVGMCLFLLSDEAGGSPGRSSTSTADRSSDERS